MKKNFLYTLLICFCLASPTLFSYPDCDQAKACSCCTTIKTECICTDNSTNTIDNCDCTTQDEFDKIVDEAVANGVLNDKIEFKKPTNFEVLLRKVGIYMFVNPYIYIVTKYRTAKEWAKNYIQRVWPKKNPKKYRRIGGSE